MSLTIGMVTIDCAHPRALADFWTKALDMTIVHDYEGEYLMLVTPGEGLQRLGLQRVPEERGGKNRLHLDLVTDDRAGEVARLVGLGATEHEEHTVPGLTWTVLSDPEGNRFCVGSAHEYRLRLGHAIVQPALDGLNAPGVPADEQGGATWLRLSPGCGMPASARPARSR